MGHAAEIVAAVVVIVLLVKLAVGTVLIMVRNLAVFGVIGGIGIVIGGLATKELAAVGIGVFFLVCSYPLYSWLTPSARK